MADFDKIEKKILSNKAVFANIANYVLFKGKPIIKPEELTPLDPDNSRKIDNHYNKLERDVVMEWKVDGVVKAIIGVENQNYIDETMAYRVQCYDNANYGDLYMANPKEVPPVITIVLYYGYDRQWNVRTTIYDVDPVLADAIEVRELYLVELAYLTDEQRELLDTDLGVISEFLVKTKNGDDYVLTNRMLLVPEHTLSLLDEISGTNNYSSMLTKEEKEREEPIIMNTIMDRMTKDWISQGKELGIKQGKELGIKQGEEQKTKELARELIKQGVSISIVASAAGTNEEEVQSWLEPVNV